MDSDGCLSVMLPTARNTIAIKFAESEPVNAKMVARALTLFERHCSDAAAYAFYNHMMESAKMHDRVMRFFSMLLLIDEPLGTLAISKAVGKKPGRLLTDIRLVGDYFGFYDKKARTYGDGITRRAHLNGTTKELTLSPEIISLLMCHYINGQRVVAMMPARVCSD